VGTVTLIKATHMNKNLPDWAQSTSLPGSCYPAADPVVYIQLHTRNSGKHLECLVGMPRITMHGEGCILNVTLHIYNTFALITEKL